MNLIKTYSYIILTLIFSGISTLAISQSNNANELTKAIQLFDKGNFADAEPLFKKVLDKKPNDFMVNYFYGACRTENNHFTNSDLECLILANREVSPININYYFAVQYHARSNWERALKFYNKYKSTASLSENENRNISEKIQECYNKINPYEEFIIDENTETIIPVATVNNQSSETDSAKTEIGEQDSVINNDTLLTAEIVDTLEKEPNPEIHKEELINFIVNNEITYFYKSNFKTEEGKELYLKGDSLQKVLKFSLKNVDELRNEYSSAKTRVEKNSIGENILAYENKIFQLKSEAPKFLIQAKTVENEYWQNATSEEIEKFNEELALLSQGNKTDTTSVEIDFPDTATIISAHILLGSSEKSTSTNKQSKNDLIYKIQIGAYSRGLPSYTKKLFNKLSLIRKIEKYTDEKGVVVYTTGNLTNYEDALKMKSQVRQEGIKDAYIVPYLKGKRITLEQAKKLQ
ncbi:MAG: hypothetical protein L3J54_00175 [Draconibacterium sp.]|nr:hypothetical protein [Draconibacterium sp.]